MTRAILLASALCLGLPGLALAQAQPAPQPNPDIISTTGTYKQNAAVLARFAPVPVAMSAPTLDTPREGYAQHAEMMSFLEAQKQRWPAMALGTAGRSQQGREIPYALFTREGVQTLEEAAKLGRPVVWFIGQQHGNEPAGGEGMLALIAELASEASRPLLHNVTVGVLPRANPDGAEAFTRTAANRADSNRDHMLMLLPETRAVHGTLRLLPPDVVFDHHEFSVANRWLEKFNALQAVDAMLLHATNPLVAREISGLAEDLYRPAIDRVLNANGLTSFWYYTTSNSRKDAVVSMGGNNPGIARNAFGLQGAVSFLVETRGVGIGKEGWQRRVATHLLTARAVIEATAANAGPLRAAIDAGRRAVAASQADLVIQARIPARDVEIPLIDPETAAPKPVVVKFQDSRQIEPTQVRPRAAGYLVLRDAAAAEKTLRLAGVGLCSTAEAVEVPVEAFGVQAQRVAANRESINPDAALKALLVPRTLAVPAGALYVPMAQAAAGVVAAALEPDTPGSYLGVGIVKLNEGEVEAPIYRLRETAGLKLAPREPADAAVCGALR
jgi:hypothetical protein